MEARGMQGIDLDKYSVVQRHDGVSKFRSVYANRAYEIYQVGPNSWGFDIFMLSGKRFPLDPYFTGTAKEAEICATGEIDRKMIWNFT